MKFIIYKITNLINGKIYVGKHQTNNVDDGYMGSGTILRLAYNKYGIENFTKEILFTVDTELEMNNKEREIVTEEFCLREDTYNLCVGGKGGFSFINRASINGGGRSLLSKEENIYWGKIAGAARKKIGYDISAQKAVKTRKQNNNSFATFSGKKHTQDSRNKISESMKKRQENVHIGSIWITNGIVNKKLKKTEIMPEGWYNGRKT